MTSREQPKHPKRSGFVLPFEEISSARDRLKAVAQITPVFHSIELNERARAQIWLKAEHLQKTGSFKFRGAYNAVAALDVDVARKGLCTVSSGNHALAIALAGRMLGAPVTAYMPSDAPTVKLSGVMAYGAEVMAFDRYSCTQLEVASHLQTISSRTYISSHDDVKVIAGAATMAFELFESVPRLDAVVVPVGGGGGLAGVGTLAKYVNPGCRVIGAEPSASAVNQRSLDVGRRLEVPVPRTIADGQTVSTPGKLAFDVMQGVVDDIVLVDDNQIVDAIRLMYELCGYVLEPSGAIGLAAVLSGVVSGERVGVILTGGNIARDRLHALLTSPLTD